MKTPAALLFAFVACTPPAAPAPRPSSAESRRAPLLDEPMDDGEPAAVELALSELRACVRTRGRVHCTSDLREGQSLAAEPPLAGIEDAISLSLGEGFGCAATRAGRVLCFGDNSVGQLGAQLRADHSDVPVPVVGIADAVRVYAGRAHACAVSSGGAVTCWGANDLGQTGSATSVTAAAHELIAAELVPGIARATSVSPGTNGTCATTRERDLWCFGVLPDGRFGPPEIEKRLSGVTELASPRTGGTCGVRDGHVFCWGDVYAIVPSDHPREAGIATMEITGARHLHAGAAHVCAVLRDGGVTCWGSNYGAALGRKAAGGGAQPPEIVAGLAPAVDLAAGGMTTCALASKSAKTAQCWGRFPRDPRASPSSGPGQETDVPVTIRLTE